MSFTEKDDKWEHFSQKSSDSEENYLTEEEGISDESLWESSTKLKYFSAEKNQRKPNVKNFAGKPRFCRLNVSLRYGKGNRHLKGKHESRKSSKRKDSKNFSEKNKTSQEKLVEILKKGKRCRLGGKAKGKPPEEENPEKHDSDDESDHCYFGRISLGYFQKFRDKSGASTSNQSEYDRIDPNVLQNSEEFHEKISEEMELLELQRWGMTALVTSYSKIIEKLDISEDIKPDKL